MSHVVVDFSVLDEQPPAEPALPPELRPQTGREAGELPRTALESVMPALNEAAPVGTRLNETLLEAAKATFTASGGNIAEVSRQHGIKPQTVARLAAQRGWPVYGDGASAREKSRRTTLKRLADMLEEQMFDLGTALGVERKELEDVVRNGTGSQYVAPLNQRSQAFSVVFDRYMRVMALLEPELFGNDLDSSNPVAARARRENPDAPGGLDGIDRRMADFAARVAVATLDAQARQHDTHDAEVVDAEVVE